MPANDIFAEDDIYQLRFLNDNDRDNYMRTLIANSTIKLVYNNAEYREWVWKSTPAENEWIFCIFEKASGAYCGYCNIQNIISNTPEVGISLLPEFQGKGLGKTVMSLMMNAYKANHSVDYFIAKVYSDNQRSLRLMKKLGAVHFQTEESEFRHAMKAIYKDMSNKELETVYKKHNIPYDDKCIIVFKIVL